MNYGDLKAHFNDLLNRTDISANTDQRGSLIKGWRAFNARLRVPVMEKQHVYIISSTITEITLPSTS